MITDEELERYLAVLKEKERAIVSTLRLVMEGKADVSEYDNAINEFDEFKKMLYRKCHDDTRYGDND